MFKQCQLMAHAHPLNVYIHQELEELASSYGCHLSCSEPSLCTDNGVMIAW